MTMTRPWRRITLHLSHILPPLGLTFTRMVLSRCFRLLLVAVDDPASSEVVRREFHHYAVLGEDPDVLLAHLAAAVREHLVSVAQQIGRARLGKVCAVRVDLGGRLFIKKKNISLFFFYYFLFAFFFY